MATELAERLDGLLEVVGPVRSGDTLIFRLSQMNPAQFAEYQEQVGDVLRGRGLDVAVIFVGNVDQILHFRPAGA